jgi:hypothetical protein
MGRMPYLCPPGRLRCCGRRGPGLGGTRPAQVPQARLGPTPRPAGRCQQGHGIPRRPCCVPPERAAPPPALRASRRQPRVTGHPGPRPRVGDRAAFEAPIQPAQLVMGKMLEQLDRRPAGRQPAAAQLAAAQGFQLAHQPGAKVVEVPEEDFGARGHRNGGLREMAGSRGKQAAPLRQPGAAGWQAKANRAPAPETGPVLARDSARPVRPRCGSLNEHGSASPSAPARAPTARPAVPNDRSPAALAPAIGPR